MVVSFLFISLAIFLLSSFICCFKKGYGFTPIFFSLYFIFVLIIPAIFHAQKNIYPFYNMSYDFEDQFKACIILIIFSAFFWIGFFLKRGSKFLIQKKDSFYLDQSRFFLGAISILSLLVFSILYYGFDTFTVRRSEYSGDAFGENTSIQSLVVTFLRALSFGILFYIVIFKKNIVKIYWWILFFLSFLVFLVINFPLSLSRFLFFSYIICFLIYYAKPNFKNKSILYFVFAFGITTLFPFMSHITRGEGKFEFNISEYYSSSGDFDSFQSIINCIIYVDRFGYTFGNQILSTIFSFIPRSFWIGKAEPTGTITASAVGYDFLNISAPLPAEFFIDFGYVGLVFLSLIFGYLVRLIDIKILWGSKKYQSYFICIVLTSLIVIISRGPLLGIINVVYCQVFVMYVLHNLFFKSLNRFGV